jgi:hypothetical protein
MPKKINGKDEKRKTAKSESMARAYSLYYKSPKNRVRDREYTEDGRHEIVCRKCGKKFRTNNAGLRFCRNECRLQYLKDVSPAQKSLNNLTMGNYQ